MGIIANSSQCIFFFFKVTPQFCKAEFDPDMHKINADLQACFIVQYTFIEYSTLVNFSSEPDLCTRSESTFNLPSWLQLCTKCRFSNTVSQQWLLRRGEFSRFSLSLLRFSQICPASRNNTREKRILLDNLWDIKKGLMIMAWSGTERASAYLSSDSMGFYSALSDAELQFYFALSETT